MDILGKSQLHPIYMSIGNIVNWRRNKPDIKQLLGYMPILKAKNNTEKKSIEFKKTAREMFHNSLKILLDSIFKLKNGLDFSIDKKLFWFIPRISIIIADWPEAATYCLTYKSSNSNFPCHFCLVTKNNLNNINLSIENIILRTHKLMKQYINKNTTKNVSIESIFNYFLTLL